MRDFVITTDTTSDLPNDYIKKHNITVLPLTYVLEGITYNQENGLEFSEFYNKMRNGSMPTTSQVNPAQAREIFLELYKQGFDILHIAFSSGLSGSYNSARLAADELTEEYKDCNILVIDSLCASMGEGLLVLKAVQFKEQGKTIEEIAEWIDKNKLHVCHDFTPMDLFHLYRGGRVSKTAAVIGTMVNVKPILHVDNAGHLIALSKVRGRKKSLTTLVDNMEKQIGSYLEENKRDGVFIGHGDSLEDAQFVADLIKQRFGIETFLIDYIGPVVGAHTGAGIIALFFMGEAR
ncbi:DegV family protein with EDD domain [Lachnotalea glycerini]|jgi:DegV family protein with EDD domain|uniref:DegV family protein n=1 Tax=Lachnotalea glycerini TaxID=1763509 RepID=A0A255IG60_9FIRM|nr:DegV family protein [Lachnotalea glycerini]PXV85398.1 DegV family protein with EDD domain [Lachnotalea glycerini]RDY30374.1 DegV family protein [Lachnotalea glycerini]